MKFLFNAMRFRKIRKEWTTWDGKHMVVDMEATIRHLEETFTGNQEEDAYWAAVDLLSERTPISINDADYWERYEAIRNELQKAIPYESGTLNFGNILIDGREKSFWETKDKDGCIRWAMADWMTNYKEL